MYQSGDVIVYATHGICTVTGLEVRLVDRKKVEYYILEPNDQSGAKFYVPTQNQAAVSKMRKLLTAEEIYALLRSDTVKRTPWIPDENRRKQHYRDLIGSGDRAAVLGMIHALHRHKMEQSAAGRKFHLCDENFLRDAEKLLSSEFSAVLGIPQDQIGSFVQGSMNVE